MIISQEQKIQFAIEGFMIVRDFLDVRELETVRAVCDESVERVETEMQSQGVTEDRINVLKKKYFINNARLTYPALNNIIFSEKTATVCQATIGDTAYLHNEQFVVKMSDVDTTFAWHQDSGYSVYQGGAARHSPYITFWIALDDMTVANGTISVLPFSRSPSRDLLEHTWDPAQNAMVGYQGEDAGDLIEVSAGTLVAFSSFLLHKSGANTTNNPRRSYFIAFTPELFTHSDPAKGVYSQGDVLVVKGKRPV